MKQNLLPRMIALAVVIVVGVYYIVFDIMQYHITSPAVPGHRPHAERRGSVHGGRRDLPGGAGGNGHGPRPRPRNVAVKLGIDAGQQIPDNGAVRVKELSALGEQYLDLQPISQAGPDLRSGTRHTRQQGHPSHADRYCAGGSQLHAPERQSTGPADR